jgi:hypothetical protein
MIQKHLHSVPTKLDVHFKVIFKASNIINPNEKSIIKQDLETFKAIDIIEIHKSITKYAVDKISPLSKPINLTIQNGDKIYGKIFLSKRLAS